MANNNFELKVEVVRFNEKDVIATSGAGMFPVNHDISDAYIVLASEFNQYEGKTTTYNSDYIYIQYDTDEDSTLYFYESVDANASGYYYAWYNAKENLKYWATDKILFENYKDKSKLPTGIDY